MIFLYYGSVVCSIIGGEEETLSFLRNYLAKSVAIKKMLQCLTLQDEKGNEYAIQGKEGVSYAYRHSGGRVITFKFSPAAFSQVNYSQNGRIIDGVLDCLAGESYDWAVDLYCGIGNLTLPLSYHAEKVTGIETSAVAVKWAILNARENKIKNCTFLQMDALDGFIFLLKKGFYPGLVVLDPPRSGAREVVNAIVRLGQEFVKKVIYISCNPATFSRDVRILTGGGFKLETITLIDMFPQSYHLEIVASLVLMSP